MSLTKVTYSMIAGSPANVLDFGADPTGVSDSTAAIQAAIDAAYEVFFPAGEYFVKNTVYFRSGNKLIGEGNYSKIVAKSDRDTDVFPILKIDGDVAFQYEMRVQDLNIVGYDSGERPVSTKHNTGIHLSNSALVVLDNVRINDCYVGIDGYCVYSHNYNKVAMFNGYLGYRNDPANVSSLGSGCTSLQFTNFGISNFVAGLQLKDTIYSKFDGYIEQVEKSNTLCQSNITPICIRLDGNCQVEFFVGFEQIDAMLLYNTGASMVKLGGFFAPSTQFAADAARNSNVPLGSQALLSIGASSNLTLQNFSAEFAAAGWTTPATTAALYVHTDSLASIEGGFFYTGNITNPYYVFQTGAGLVNVGTTRFSPQVSRKAYTLATSATTSTSGTLIWGTVVNDYLNLITINTSNGRIQTNLAGVYKFTVALNVDLTTKAANNTYLQVSIYDVGGSATLAYQQSWISGGAYEFIVPCTALNNYTISVAIDGTAGATLINSSTNKPTLYVEYLHE